LEYFLRLKKHKNGDIIKSMIDDLLEIEETKKEKKTEEDYYNSKKFDLDFDDGNMGDMMINQILNNIRKEELEKNKKIENDSGETKRVINRRTSLGALELMDDGGPTINEFVKSLNKEKFPAVVNNSLNALTVRSTEFRENLLNNDMKISPMQQTLIREYTQILENRVQTKLPNSPLTAEAISVARIDSMFDLVDSIRKLEQSIDFVETSLDVVSSDELIEELTNLSTTFDLYNSSYSFIAENLDLYIRYKGDDNYDK